MVLRVVLLPRKLGCTSSSVAIDVEQKDAATRNCERAKDQFVSNYSLTFKIKLLLFLIFCQTNHLQHKFEFCMSSSST